MIIYLIHLDTQGSLAMEFHLLFAKSPRKQSDGFT
jgi:hypothetical protein